MTASISVIVPVLNEEKSIASLLDALTDQLLAGDEVVVVDGGSTDGTATIAAQKGDPVRVLSAPGTNISQARNAGVLAAANDVIACTDAGCSPGSMWLDSLRSCVTSEPAPDLVTGIYEVSAGTPFEAAMAAACYPDPDARQPSGWASVYGRLFGRTFDSAFPTGRSMAFTKRAWSRVGGFPEDLETAEDVTFGRSIAQAGLGAVLCPEARVVWRQRPTFGSTARMYFRYGSGGGRSQDAKVISRDVIRAAAYGLGVWGLVAGGNVMRAAIALGAAVYLSVPLARAARGPHGAAAVPLVPVALATKDLSKAAGCLIGLSSRRERSHPVQRDIIDDERAAPSDRSLDPKH
ncbi:MAG: glycosyltransferase [Actinomycetota bacterium]